MPELPEVETVRRGLAPAMVGQTIAEVALARADLRFPFPPDFAARLTGRQVTALSRRAKYLVATLDDDTVLLMHLGMSGRFLIENGATSRPGRFHHPDVGAGVHDHVAFRLGDGTRIVYSDPRRFGYMALTTVAEAPQHPLLARIGCEPLGNSFHAGHLDAVLAGRKTSIKAALLDQRVVAGLGNIYVCEALHRARISPRRKSATVPGRRAARLAPAIRDVLTDAIAAGGSTLRDYMHADGELGYFQHDFAVYDRDGEACPTPGCGRPIRRIVQAGRSTFFCGACQR